MCIGTRTFSKDNFTATKDFSCEVNCKDCKHWDIEDNDLGTCHNENVLGKTVIEIPITVSSDFGCKFFERKEGK